MIKKIAKKGRIRRVAKKLKRPFGIAFKIWRGIIVTILSLIIMPLFLASHYNDKFFAIVLSATALICGLIIIIKEPLPKKIARVLENGMLLLLGGGLLIAIAAYLPLSFGFINWRVLLLVISAFFYAFGIQRLGLGAIIGLA